MYSNNFGVIEVASARTTTAPGWAYVPDTSAGGVKALPSNRKRARNQGPNLTGADLSARQEAKVRRELEALDRDNSRDVHIPIPPKKGGAKGEMIASNLEYYLARASRPRCRERLAD